MKRRCHSIRNLAASMVLCVALGAHAADAAAHESSPEEASFRCHVFGEAPLFRSNFIWDGSTPFQTNIQTSGEMLAIRIQEIGLRGHPEYIFEMRYGRRLILSTSQGAGLTDYVMTWKAADAQATLSSISVSCSKSGSD